MIVFKQTKYNYYYYTDDSEECINMLWERLLNLDEDEYRKAQFKVFHYPDTNLEDYFKRTPKVGKDD